MKDSRTIISTRGKSVATGIALTLILIIVVLWSRDILFYKAAAITLIINMALPAAYRPLSVIWSGLADSLSFISTKIALGIVYFLILLPVGLFRRIIGKYTLKLKQFKKSSGSVMLIRNHQYTGTDLINPF